MVYTANNTSSAYYFQRNLMGDVVAIYDTNGAKVASYTYDAWGNCKIESSTTNYTVANANPFRYRGYYYDTDTGLYYLNARYYSPEFRRFISPDDTSYLDPKNVNGCNLYTYYGNNPTILANSDGHFAWTVETVVLVALVSAVVHSNYSKNEEKVEPAGPKLIKDKNGEYNIYFSVDVSKLQSDEDINEYVDNMVNQLEKDFADYLKGSSIDRKQLYCELKFHKKNMWWYSGANPADINIYSDGSVIDLRPYLNWLAKFYGSGYID